MAKIREKMRVVHRSKQKSLATQIIQASISVVNPKTVNLPISAAQFFSGKHKDIKAFLILLMVTVAAPSPLTEIVNPSSDFASRVIHVGKSFNSLAIFCINRSSKVVPLTSWTFSKERVQ